MPIDLARLMDNDDVRDAFGTICDLYPEDDPRTPVWCSFDTPGPTTAIARDGGGGMFVTIATSPDIIYVSSEGAVGRIATSIDEFVALLVSLPYWQDLLKFSGGGKLAEMHRAQPALETYWLESDDDNETTRELLRAETGVSASGDLVAILHHNVATSTIVARASDGHPAETLFGSFTIDDSPELSCPMQ
jgi:hypothetical protein